MKMYRAVPKDGFKAETLYTALPSRRTPSNVPYLVDNIWEWLRPSHAPSRRHAVYASPTPELALANASAAGIDPSLYIACELVFDGEGVKLAHLNVVDARQHKDISRLLRHVSSRHGADFSNLALAEKLAFAPLYLPAVSREELSAYFASSAAATKLSEELALMSTFWDDTSSTPEDHNGELFFELPPGAVYQLKLL